MNPHIIDKSELRNLQFRISPVIRNSDNNKEIGRKLHHALTLGNNEKNKCRIILDTTDGIKSVETTIWAVTDSHICLKGGVTIAIAALVDIII